jgi:hypothetical protein
MELKNLVCRREIVADVWLPGFGSKQEDEDHRMYDDQLSRHRKSGNEISGAESPIFSVVQAQRDGVK